jgi:predicted DNA-binding transcriptional regulator YafY
MLGVMRRAGSGGRASSVTLLVVLLAATPAPAVEVTFPLTIDYGVLRLALRKHLGGQVTTRREVDPYHLRYIGGALYLDGYDHLRRRLRTFAVERIRALTVTDHAFQLPLGFDIDDYLGDVLVVMQGRPIDVELVFDKPTAAWVRDRVWHPSQVLGPLSGGRLRMTLRVADTRELLGWILSFGRGVEVIRPAGLRDRVRAEALAVSRQ